MTLAGKLRVSRGPEMYLPLWLSLFGSHGSPLLNIEVCTARRARPLSSLKEGVRHVG